jgi:hypothetical protein
VRDGRMNKMREDMDSNRGMMAAVLMIEFNVFGCVCSEGFVNERDVVKDSGIWQRIVRCRTQNGTEVQTSWQVFLNA